MIKLSNDRVNQKKSTRNLKKLQILSNENHFMDYFGIIYTC